MEEPVTLYNISMEYYGLLVLAIGSVSAEVETVLGVGDQN